MDYFYQVEDRDGVRFSWNVWPTTKAEASRSVLPVACMYTPLKKGTNVQMAGYEPVQCKGPCKSFLNPFCGVDFSSKAWTCPFCLSRNQLPQHYSGITQTALPMELHPQMTTIEYQLTKPNSRVAPAFLFVVDTCLRPEELESLKESLLQTIELLPANAYVGLITFGTTVQLWELAFSACPKAYAFSSKKAMSAREMHDILGLGNLLKDNRIQANTVNSFVAPLGAVEDMLIDILEQLEVDPFPVEPRKRALRATGVAVSVAVSVLENTFSGLGGRVMVFMGGPPTVGPGMAVSEDLKEPIRSHHELRKETAKYFHQATKFYDELADRASGNGHAVDLFSCALDQTGLMEMRSLAKETGGLMVLCEGFEHEIFKKSIVKMFDKDSNDFLQMGFQATLEAICSKDLKTTGAIGLCASAHRQTSSTSESEMGIGNTSAWKAGAMDPSSTFTIFFEIGKADKSNNGMVQFQTTYQHPSGSKVLRVTTVAHGWADPAAGNQALAAGFDQECAASVMARFAVWKAEREEVDCLRLLDTNLINFTKRFADYAKGNPSSFSLATEMALFPQFMFYLRRGPLIQAFNNSPDETVFFRYCLLRETVSNSLVMIQPTLDSYTLDNDPQPVLLSATAIETKNILLLDTFFHIVIHVGDTIAQWRKAGYHEQSEYENLRDLLEMPKEDASELMKSRLPIPMYVECDQHTSQARFLVATLDPAITHMTYGTDQPLQSGQIVFTEDANLSGFVEKLKTLTVGESSS